MRGIPVDPRFAALFAAACPSGIGVVFEAVSGIGVVQRELDLAGLWEAYLGYVENHPAAAAKLLLCLRREANRLRAPAAVPEGAAPQAGERAPVGETGWKPRVVK